MRNVLGYFCLSLKLQSFQNCRKKISPVLLWIQHFIKKLFHSFIHLFIFLCIHLLWNSRNCDHAFINSSFHTSLTLLPSLPPPINPSIPPSFHQSLCIPSLLPSVHISLPSLPPSIHPFLISFHQSLHPILPLPPSVHLSLPLSIHHYHCPSPASLLTYVHPSHPYQCPSPSSIYPFSHFISHVELLFQSHSFIIQSPFFHWSNDLPFIYS